MMATIVDTVRRVIRRRRPLRLHTLGDFTIVRDDVALENVAARLAEYREESMPAVRARLRALWQLDTTTLYVHVEGAPANAKVVITPRSSRKIVAHAQRFSIETETEEPAPDGSYLTQREYRRLGFYEQPPAERAIVVLRLEAGAGSTYLVDVPPYVRRATVVVNGRLLGSCVAIPESGDLRYGA